MEASGDPQSAALRLVRRLARALMGAYYPDLAVLDADRVPEGPLVVAANHPNSLVDPVLISTCLPRRIHWLAKATLFATRPARAVLLALGAIPVHRRHEGGTRESTADTLRAAADVLVSGRAIGIFPEGVSHDRLQLAPLKTGAGRLAIQAAAQLEASGRAERVRVLPVVLHFPEKTRFRSAAIVAVGEPFPVAAGDDAETVTDRVRAGIEALLVHVEDERQERLLRHVALLVRRRFATAAEDDPHERHRVDREVAAAVRRFSRDEPGRVDAFARKLDAHLRRLEAHGIRLDALEPRPATAARVPLALALLPVAAWGTLHSWVPYRLAAWLATLGPDRTVVATWALGAGLLAFPLWWGLLAAAIAAAWGAAAALAFLATAPPTALAARWSLLVLRSGLARAWDRLVLGARPRSARRLESQRAELWSEIERWRDLHLASLREPEP